MFSRLPASNVQADPDVLNGSDNDDIVDEISIDVDENEFEDMCGEDDSAPSDRAKKGQIIEALFKVSKDFGGKFTSTKTKIIHGLESAGQSISDLKLSLTTDLNSTWLRTPDSSSSDPVGHWKPNDLDFKSKNKWVPQVFTKQHPKRIPFEFVDPESAKFFNDKLVIVPGRKIPLPSTVFSPNSTVIANTNLHEFEFLGRQGVFDAEITHNLLDLNQDIGGSLSQLFNSLNLCDQDESIVEGIQENFQNLLNVNKLAMQSNYRSKTFSIQTCVKAKSELRTLVLNKYKDDAGTKEILMGSSFFSDSLFGPLPKTLTDIPSSCSGKTALLTSVYKSNNPAPKRKSGAIEHPQAPHPKRGNYGGHNNQNRRNYRNSNYYNNFNNYNNNNNKPNSLTSEFSTSSLFPKGPRQNQGYRGGKKGSKR